MAAGFVEEVGLERTGELVGVPNHPTANLMYYLRCVRIVLRMDNPNINYITNFNNYNRLNQWEIDDLLRLACLFKPDALIGKVFFQSDELCGSNNNDFFELSRVAHLFAVSNDIVVGGQRKQVMKIMTFKLEWLRENYLEPMLYYKERLSRLAHGLPGYAPPQPQYIRVRQLSDDESSEPPLHQMSQCCTIL